MLIGERVWLSDCWVSGVANGLKVSSKKKSIQFVNYKQYLKANVRRYINHLYIKCKGENKILVTLFSTIQICSLSRFIDNNLFNYA